MKNIKYVVCSEKGNAFCVDLDSVAEFIISTNSKNVYIGYYNPISDTELLSLNINYETRSYQNE